MCHVNALWAEFLSNRLAQCTQREFAGSEGREISRCLGRSRGTSCYEGRRVVGFSD